MQNPRTRTSGHQMRPPRGCCRGRQTLRKCVPDWAISEGARHQWSLIGDPVSWINGASSWTLSGEPVRWTTLGLAGTGGVSSISQIGCLETTSSNA